MSDRPPRDKALPGPPFDKQDHPPADKAEPELPAAPAPEPTETDGDGDQEIEIATMRVRSITHPRWWQHPLRWRRLRRIYRDAAVAAEPVHPGLTAELHQRLERAVLFGEGR